MGKGKWSNMLRSANQFLKHNSFVRNLNLKQDFNRRGFIIVVCMVFYDDVDSGPESPLQGCNLPE